jgi:hypothetical protein
MKLICNACGLEKDESFFSFKNKTNNIRNTKCKDCHKIYVSQHYTSNKLAYKQRAKNNSKLEYQKNRALIENLKKDGCIVCGESRTEVLDLHHLDPSIKENNISNLSRSKMIVEAKKCVILCSNCHRMEHHLLRKGETQLNMPL